MSIQPSIWSLFAIEKEGDLPNGLSAKTFLSYRDVETSKAAVEQMIEHIKVPLLIVYDRADNIQGKGTITRRENIAARIKESAVNCPRADIVVIPSHPGNSPFQAHLFVNNERTVTQETVKWLTGVGLAPARHYEQTS